MPHTAKSATSAALLEVCGRIPSLNQAAMAQASARQASLTKPAGSLGRLERLAVQVAGITGQPRPRLARKLVVVMVGDHGVAAEGISRYPSAVTAQMVRNFASGGAAINVLARLTGARLVIVDVGVAEEFQHTMPLEHRKVALGTANLANLVLGPAMTHGQATAAMLVGVEVVEHERVNGLDVVCLGEMGIGNTTAASAIVAAITGLPVEQVTGLGSSSLATRTKNETR